MATPIDVVVFKCRKIFPTQNCVICNRNFFCQVNKLFTWQKNKISVASQTVPTARIAPKICQGQPPTMYSEYVRFHPNRLTFGV